MSTAKSGSGGGGSTPEGLTPSLSMASPTQQPKANPSLWFVAEIQQMMHGLGDCRRPLSESAALIEEIVHQQMVRALYQAEEAGKMRNARFLGIEDFLFLLRHDKVKLRRLIRYMTLKDMKAAAYKGNLEEEEGAEGGGESRPPLKKRRKICYDFLSVIDQTGELLSLFEDDALDDVKHQRALRAELYSKQLDCSQYLEYCESRQASFTPRYRMQKFRDWLSTGLSLDIKPNPLAIEVLSYLAYETVAQIVDLALHVKQDKRAVVEDPFSQTMPPVCLNHDSAPSAPSTGTPTLITTPSGAGLRSPPLKSGSAPNLTSPTSGPSTPGQTTPGTGAIPSGATPGLSPASSTPASKAKSAKKKKKGGFQPSRDLFTNDAITSSDIREAMRRYSQCVGPFADFSKAPLTNPRSLLLCT